MLSLLPPYVAAFVYLAASLVMARLYLGRSQFGGSDIRHWWMLWMVISTAAFFTYHIVVFILVLWIVLARFLPASPNDKLVSYVAILPVIPIFDYQIPGALGISYLFTINYPRLLILLVLIPLLVHAAKSRPPRGQPQRSRVDIVVAAYTVWLCILAFRSPSITDALRRILETLLFTTLPYYAISRAPQSMNDLRRMLIALVFSAIMVSFAGLLEQYAKWWFYSYVPAQLKLQSVNWLALISYGRGGLIRVKASIDGGLGYFLIIAGAALMCLRPLQAKRWFVPSALALFATILFFTGARGSYMAGILMVALFFSYRLVDSRAKVILLMVATLAAVPSMDSFIASYQDEHGTFEYRRQLLAAAIPVIFDHFWLGFESIQQLEATGRLEHMRQGEGIIDIVNTYLYVGLFTGGPGLLLFVGIFVTVMMEMLGLKVKVPNQESDEAVRIRRFVITSLLMTMFLIMTVSPVGYLPSYYWLLFAFGAAYVRLQKQAAVDARARVGKEQATATLPSGVLATRSIDRT